MTEQFSQWDSARYLRTDDEIAAYIDACLEEGGTDAAFVTQALRTVARAKGTAVVAEQAGLTEPELDRLLCADQPPSFSAILRVIHALGLRLHAERAA